MSKGNIYTPTPEEDAQIQVGINADPDAFEITPEMISSGQVVQRRRGKQKSPLKIQKTIRFDPQVLAYFEPDKPGWQKRLATGLKIFIEEHPKVAI
ncbi:MAG: hypothetical protein ACI8WB_004088 [Phenylobacterium sp.]|jgi:uncharacterized protein (DUF4415 family)